MEDFYFDPNKIVIRNIDKNIAKSFIIKHHYSHKWSLCMVSYGIFFINNDDHKSNFFSENNEKLIGAIVYGGPVGRLVWTSISDLLNLGEVIELTRLAILDNYGKNIESYVISRTLKMLKQDMPKVKVVISYSDQEMNHKGTIYQASGFYYQGTGLSLMPNYSLSLDGPPNYNWIHSRTVSDNFGSKNIDHLKKCIGKTFYLKRESSKLRYIKFICSKEEKKKLLSTLKYPILSYPKNIEYIEEIHEIKVNNNDDNSYFK